MSDVCPIHGEAWKTVPAGVSKSTGKPYRSFRACPVQGCRERPAQAPRPNGQQSASLGQPSASQGLSERELNLAIITACLNFAGLVFSGSGASGVDDAKILAKEMYDNWRSKA